MRKKRLAELVIMTMLGITACGGGASTSSKTSHPKKSVPLIVTKPSANSIDFNFGQF